MFFLRSGAKAGRLSTEEAVSGCKDGSIIVVDVRELMEVRTTGIAEGALHIPLSRLRDMADPRHPDFVKSLKNDAKIALYCASGGRSYNGEQIMRQLGYTDVHNIGGIHAWVRAGGAIAAA